MPQNADEPADPKQPEEDEAADAPSDEEAPPMNRAERRLAERRKKRGPNATGRAVKPSKADGGSSMRGRGFQSGTRQRGTNTRRSG